MKTNNINNNIESKKGASQVTNIITEAEGVKVGDKVRHNKHEEVATVTAIREAFVNRADGYRYLYTLDFGQSVLGPFQVELNGGEFLREAFTLCNPSEITEQREQNDACISTTTNFTNLYFRFREKVLSLQHQFNSNDYGEITIY